MKHSGFFITMEGGEGAGKTSAIRLLERMLTDNGLQVLVTREPGGIPIAEQIRSVILDERNVEMDDRTEALLYAAARRQHLVQKVIPALQEGNVVLCDRFIDSSLAYQGFARGLGIDEIYEMNRFAISETMPDVTFFLDVSPETGLKRIYADHQREVNRLDREKETFHRLVRDGYLQLMERFPERIVRIDANLPLEHVYESIAPVLIERMKVRFPDRNMRV